MKISKTKVLALASGAGSTFEYLAEKGGQSWQICGLISNKDCGAVKISQSMGYQTVICDPKAFASYEEWDKALAIAAKDFQPDLILLAGFLKKIGPYFLDAFEGMILNTHPSLLPAYGGRGMYGRKIHEQVYNDKKEFSGVTIHWVNEDYDSGQIISQSKVKITEGDSVDTIEAKVKALEKSFLAQTLDELCQ